MAIVKMRKLRVLAAAAQKEELIRQLMLLGCAQMRDMGELAADERFASLLSRENGGTAGAQAERALVADGIRLLNKYAPYKKPLLSAKPLVSQDEFLDNSDLDEAKAVAEELVHLDETIRACYQEEAQRGVLLEVLSPWKDFQTPLDCAGTKYVAMRLGTLPVMSDYDGLCAELENKIVEASVEQVSIDEHTRYLCVFFLREKEAEAMEVLRSFGFAAPAFGTVHGLAKDNMASCRERLLALAAQRKSCEEKIVSYVPKRDMLFLCYDRLSAGKDRADAIDLMLRTEKVVVLEAWTTAPETQALEELLGKFDCAWEFEEPEEEEYPSVPVKLKNNFFTGGLNMVTNMYSLPQYGTVDPNPLMAPFFILFYGLMMADMGYGLLMVIAALVAMKKMRPRDGTLSFCQLLLWGGISTFIMGALTGGFFADAPYQIVHMINPDSTWQGLPSLFDPLNDSIYVLLGSLVLGVIHLITGMVISFVQKLRHGDIAGAVFYELAMWIVFIGAALAIFGVGSIGGVPVVLCVGGVMLIYGSTRGKKGFGKVTAIFGLVYNELTGWFGDILSYTRIMALMLAGSVVGQVFNTIGAMFGNVLLFIVIFLIGHALNFALNLLGCYVHDLRLQCLEFFKKFYVDGGKPFKPLKVNTKYVEVTK
ncbi:MAG: V-type ATP synthase subunit I [Oscillospiraceae bacterium]